MGDICTYTNWILANATADQNLAWLKANAKDAANGCLEWIGTLAPVGYGCVSKHVDKSRYAHRAMYRLSCGSIPEKMYVCHSCDNRKCINPEHLFLGTCQDNIKDMQTKGRNSWGINPPIKFSMETITKIRAEHATGKRYTVLMREYGISDGHLNRVLRNEVRRG